MSCVLSLNSQLVRSYRQVNLKPLEFNQLCVLSEERKGNLLFLTTVVKWFTFTVLRIHYICGSFNTCQNIDVRSCNIFEYIYSIHIDQQYSKPFVCKIEKKLHIQNTSVSDTSIIRNRVEGIAFVFISIYTSNMCFSCTNTLTT